MTLCIFNPEHDLCLANGNPNYMPPASAIRRACRDAGLMQALYPGATCCSVYDPELPTLVAQADTVVAWGWNSVVRQALLRQGCPPALLPSEADLSTILRLQHRTSILPLQPDCRAISSVAQLEPLLDGTPLVLKAPLSGAGHGLRWLRGTCTDKDLEWLHKTLDRQQCVIVEPWRAVDANLAFLYDGPRFVGYSCFETQAGVYRRNLMWPDSAIEAHFAHANPHAMRADIEQWLQHNVWPHYRGPLGVDLMLCGSRLYVAELNLRHTMGMVAHAQIPQCP